MEAGCIAGPFDEPPFENFRCSPVSLRKKSTAGQFWLLTQLILPYNEKSINHNIPKNYSTVQYSTLQNAIQLIQKHGAGCYMAKSDIKGAFRIVPLHPSQYYLMGFKWENKYYYDKNLAMGLSSSCQIFEAISDAVVFILNTKYKITDVVKILDNFLFVQLSKDSCQRNLNSFLELRKILGIPVAMEKISDIPTQIIVFIGILLDSVRMLAKLAEDKLQNYSGQVAETLDKSKLSLWELQSVIGHSCESGEGFSQTFR